MHPIRSLRRLLVLPAILAMAALTGCASQITHQELTPIKVDVSRPHPQSVTVTALPKAGASGAESATAMAELRTALSESITGYKVFGSVKPQGGDYQLTVQIFSIQSPMFGASFTTKAELGWTLTRSDTGAVVWQEAIKSEHTTSMSEAFVGAERSKMSIAGAVRRNIGIGLEKIGALAL